MLIKKIFYQELVSSAVKTLTVLVVILPITELFKLLENGGASNLPAPTLLALMLYGTIASFPMILTISCFLTVVITLNRYCKDSEFVVWLSSGISPFFWLRAVALFALPLAILCAVSTMYITPWATAKKDGYTEFLSKQQTNILISPGVFRENGNGRDVFYLDHYSFLTGYAKNIFVQYVSSDGVLYNITATDGKLENRQGLSSLVLKNGERYQISGGNNDQYSRMDMYFGTLTATIKQNYDPTQLGVNVSTSSVPYLVNMINKTNNNGAKAELSWRISIAVMMFVMTIFAVPISIQVGRVQSSLVFVLPPIIYAVYNNVVLSVNSYLASGTIHYMFIVQLIHITLIMFAILLTYYKTYPKGYLFSRRRNKK